MSVKLDLFEALAQVIQWVWLMTYLQVDFNPNQSSLTLEGDDIESFEKVMQHISYLNSRQFPTPGIRHLRVTTTVKSVSSSAFSFNLMILLSVISNRSALKWANVFYY